MAIDQNYRDLNGAFAYYTSCQIATLHHLARLKATTKSELLRQRSIAIGMIAACFSSNLPEAEELKADYNGIKMYDGKTVEEFYHATNKAS